jgi:hypothetical protein
MVADYLRYVDQYAVGAIEAKPEVGTGVQIWRSARSPRKQIPPIRSFSVDRLIRQRIRRAPPGRPCRDPFGPVGDPTA